MGSETFFSTVNDCDTNTTFAVVVLDEGRMTAHGSVKQGKDWAGWVNAGAKSLDQIRLSLDPSLRMTEFVPLSRENLMARYSLFGPTTAKHLIALIEGDAPNAPVSIEFPDIESKSAETGDTEALPPEPVEEQEPESEPIQTWLMSDVGISMFDVQIKKDAVEFKARQFTRNKNFASFITCVKGSKATVFDGRWRAMPRPAMDLTNVLERFDRKIKTNAFVFLDRIGYFEKSAPIGLVNLPPPHIVRDADSDTLIYEGIPWINMGRGILDPTPLGMGEMIRGVRSFGGGMANILNKPSRVSRMTRRNAEAERINALAAATNDLNRLIPNASQNAAGASRLRRRLSDLADSIKPATQSSFIGDRPRTRRENRRILEGESRLAQAGNLVSRPFGDGPMAAMRNERGESPETSPIVRAAEQRTEADIARGSSGGQRSGHGKNPRKDGERILDRLSARLSRISRGLGRSDAAETADMDDVPVPPTPADAPSGVVGDPWLMDDASKRNLLSAIDALRATEPNGARRPFNSRFAEDEIEWSDFTPAEQSSLVGQLRSRRDQLVASINEIMTPELPGDPDYRVDGVVTPESVANAVADGHYFLTEGGANLYPDVTALLAIDDILSSTDPAKQSSAWRMIDDRNRSVVSRAAEIQRRDMRDASHRRTQGAIGERTVINPKWRERGSMTSLLLPLSKIQPRRLVFTPEKPADLKKITEYTALEQQAIIESAHRLRHGIADYLRSKLNIAGDTPMTEDVLATRILNLAPDDAAKIQQYAHNLIVLDELVTSAAPVVYGTRGQVGPSMEPLWSALTIPARDKILSEANVGLVPQVSKTSKPKPRKSRTPRVTATPVAPTPPQQPTSSPSPPKGNVPIGLSPVQSRLGDFGEATKTPVSVVVDATNRVVTTTLEDGTQETKPLSSFGRPNQYDLTNSLLIDDVFYVFEPSLGLYRDPVTGNYLTDYSQVPISINSQISIADALGPVQSSKKLPDLVSYPSITPSKDDTGRKYGLSDEGPQKLTVTEVLARVFNIDEELAKDLLGTKIYYAPGVLPGKSTNSFRQAALLLLNTSTLNNAIPQGEKQKLQMLDVVDIPEGSDPIESYLNYIGRPDIAVGYVAAGRPANFLEFQSRATQARSPRANATNAREGMNIPDTSLLPEHLKGYDFNRYYRSAILSSIFAAEDPSDDFQTLIPGMAADAKPRVRKMVVLWRHPDNFSMKHLAYRDNLTQVQEIALAVNKALSTDHPNDWFAAFEAVRNAYDQARERRRDALNKWRNVKGAASRSPRPRREFILAGEMLESLETILADIFENNMHKVEDSVRQKSAGTARVVNEMGRLRKRAVQSGLRNVAGLEESLLIPPVNLDGTPLPPRGVDEILGMVERHTTLGFLPHIPRTLTSDDPIELAELSEEAISTLALINMAVEELKDPETQRPLQEVLGRHHMGNPQRNALHNAIYWATGAKGRPILVTEDEFELLAGSTMLKEVTVPPVSGDQWVMNFVEMRRGIAMAKPPMTTNQMAAELIKGPLYIVGEGGEHGGSGINFARRAGMLNYGGRDPSGDIVLALIPRTTRIENKDRMSAIHGQLLEMYGAFFSAITHFSGIEKTMPIDLDADNDPDWSHDNMANPFYRSNRSLTAHGYFVPYGKKSVGAHRGQIGGATLESHARAKGITIPQVDTADPEAIRDLAKILLTISEDLFSRNDNEFSWDSERGARVDAQADPLYGKQWWRATRMQIFGWMVQLEVLKSMEMAKLKAEGKVPWNERLANLVSAQEILSFWNDEVTMGMLFGVDVYQSGGDLPMTQNPVALFRPSVIGDHIMVLNRTALVMLHKPVTQAAEAEIYSLIRNPQIRKPDDPSKVWNPYYQRWIDDPDFGTTAQDET